MPASPVGRTFHVPPVPDPPPSVVSSTALGGFDAPEQPAIQRLVAATNRVATSFLEKMAPNTHVLVIAVLSQRRGLPPKRWLTSHMPELFGHRSRRTLAPTAVGTRWLMPEDHP